MSSAGGAEASFGATTAKAFAARSAEEQVRALGDLVARALPAWGLAGSRIDLIKYRENAVFAVTAESDERFVLRVHRPGYRSDAEIRSEIAWMHALGRDGFATPSAVAARSGDYVVVESAAGVPEPRQCDLLTWVEGSPPGSLEEGVRAPDDEVRALYVRVGWLAARMQAHAATWPKPPGFVRPAWDLAALVGEHPTLGRFVDLDVLDGEAMAVLLAARERVRARLAELGPADVLIHGDLIPNNILVDGDVARIIDFDDFGWSWAGFELATSIFPLKMSGGLEAGLEGYLEGYRRVRPFPDADLERLPDLLMARLLSYLGWPAGRPEMEFARDMAPLFAALAVEAAAEYLAS